MSEADRRDWCYYERVVTLADQSQLEPALTALGQIDSVMVRAFATERLISVAPEGLTVQRAEGLCNSLDEPHRTSCVKSWSRPHLWEGAQ